MSLSQSPALTPGPANGAMSHLHAVSEVCPTCDQLIPHDKFDEIKERIQARQSERETQITTRLMEEFGRQKSEAVEQARKETAATVGAKVASAREEERQAAESAANQKLAETERVNNDALAAMQTRIEQAETAKSDAQAQVNQVRRDSAETIEKMKQDAEAKETAIRDDAQKQAAASIQEKLVGMERSRQESEAVLQTRVKEAEDAKLAAQQSNAALQNQLNQSHAEGVAAIEKAQQDADARVNTAHQEATAAAETAMHEKVAGAELAKTAAESKAAAAEEAARVLQERHESQTEARVSEVRLAMEADKLQAVNAVNAARSEDNRKMSEQFADMQRKLDQKTAEQLGEGAEVDLYEDLKARFESVGDKIERVGKGKPGADVIHTVKHNGMVCGKIIYDSKNHGQWRYDFAEKLAADKIAEKADHAILSTRKFPEGMKQLDVMDGVILANPARVVALVQVVREHIVKSHTLRMSNEEKALKSAELYAFITSTQYTDLLDRIDTQAQELLDMRVKEQKAHEKMWKDQDILYRSIQKTGGELSNRVDIILGTAGEG
jgi:hypothetical protein